MSDRDPPTVEQTTKNIRLAGQFLREVLDDPSILDEIEDGTPVVLLPADDPDLAMANFALATELVQEGKEVRLRTVGGPAPEAERWRAVDMRGFTYREIKPHWAPNADPRELTIVYDHAQDTLLIDLFRGRRQGIAVPFNPFVLLLVDIKTQEAFAYLIPGFIARAVRKVPRLGIILAAAELRPLTFDELGGLVPPMADAPGEEAEPRPRIESKEDFDALMSDIERLIA